MAMAMLLQILLPFALGLMASLAMEHVVLKPNWSKPIASIFMHTGTWCLLFPFGLVLLQRPWFALVVALAFQVLLLLVNHAKHDSLREAFVFQDFEYFTDTIKHPLLYLPFFGIGRTLIATAGFLTALWIGLSLETPLTATLALGAFALFCCISFLAGLSLVRLGLHYCPEPSFNPATDLNHLGQFGFFWCYWQAENHPAPDLSNIFASASLNCQPESKSPHVIAVQSESFFDPRPLSAQIKPDVLAHFDEIRAQACHYGRLQVPAWGANTVRTEAAFLTGLTEQQLGVHRFNPYRLFVKQDVANLARYLKMAGYRTVCIHPYPASFYQRHKVFPKLGFDQFIDISGFTSTQKQGQFIGDLAIADMIGQMLHDADPSGPPLFIFVITMENHGPLHMEKPAPQDQETFYRQTSPSAWSDLTVYLRHLKNADLMIKKLQDNLSAVAGQRGGILCWYGDHVPIMNSIYGQLGVPDGQTDYFIWQSWAGRQLDNGIGQAIAISDLPKLLISALKDKIN